MGRFAAFRTRILSTLAAAGVAQGCGGTVVGEPPSARNETPPGENKPGCLPILDADASIAAAEARCGDGTGNCSPSDSTECFDQIEIHAVLRDCATPVPAGTCPAPTDLDLGVRCAVALGHAELIATQCCYPGKRLSCAVPGRPLRVNGKILLPEIVIGNAMPPTEEPGLGAAARSALAELWCEGARYEYASVASFARSALQLMALGAPAELVAASQAASLDEIEHARLCFALAGRFSARELRAGALSVEAFANAELGDLAVENVLGGCVGETVAALTAVEQLGVATDPEVRAALERIAEDEARHAELAWRIAAWTALVGGPGVRARMTAAFESALGVRPGNSAVLPLEAVAMEGHGQLAPVRERGIRDRILDEIVAPCARALLAA
jgi:hypothetical protein